MREDVVVTNALTKRFGELVAVSSLDLKIPRGVVYGLIGPNGSGKTTAIKVMNGLLRATSGSARLLGEEVPVKEVIHRIGYMPQEMAIYTDLTVHENLELFAGMYSMPRSAFEGAEKDLLEIIDLAERRDSLVTTLSGGMKHRVSLACALVHDPELVFLDEPTVGVDPELRKGFWDYFAGLKSAGKTVVLTTHYMDEAVRCDIVGMMRLGEMIAESTPDALMKAAGATTLEDAFLANAKEADV
ncbi:MAG: ABC transporter ATP-binding protein [Thermoplasmata archaeon]|nr:ABC transporter ATP-binding protein [Thermoplasmata archaeon]